MGSTRRRVLLLVGLSAMAVGCGSGSTESSSSVPVVPQNSETVAAGDDASLTALAGLSFDVLRDPG